MKDRFDSDKWHRQALENSKISDQIFRLAPVSSYEELFTRINILEAQLAARDALIERLIDAGNVIARELNDWSNFVNEVQDMAKWDDLVAEYRAMKKESEK